MSRIWFAMLALSTLLLSGCYFLGGSSPKTRFYSLEVTSQPVQQASAVTLRIGVGPIRIPDSLHRPQIVTRTAAYERSYADFDHWAGSLETNLSRVLSSVLMAHLPAAQVRQHPWPHTREIDYQVRINILRMEGTLGESASLEGTMTWVDMKARTEIAHQRFNLRRVPGNGSYQALVAAWSELANQLGGQIASHAISLPAP